MWQELAEDICPNLKMSEKKGKVQKRQIEIIDEAHQLWKYHLRSTQTGQQFGIWNQMWKCQSQIFVKMRGEKGKSI